MAARGRPLIVAAAALLCALSLQGCVLDGSLDEFLDSPGIEPPSKRSSPTSEELDAPKIFRRASPAVSTVISSFDADGQATAIGLAAAIPAVMAYNYFADRVRVLGTEMENFASEFLNIAERHFLK